MTDSSPDETPQFETDEVDANRAREQGLGLGERELAAQSDPGGTITAGEDEVLADEVTAVDEDVEGSIGVQGTDEDDAVRTSDV